jgi:hypothetical protein
MPNNEQPKQLAKAKIIVALQQVGPSSLKRLSSERYNVRGRLDLGLPDNRQEHKKTGNFPDVKVYGNTVESGVGSVIRNLSSIW